MFIDEIAVINTRPATRQKEMNALLEELGIKYVINPFFVEKIYQLSPAQTAPIIEAKNIIITSKYAWDSMKQNNLVNFLTATIVTIGKGLYSHIKNDYQNIINAGKNSKELLSYIITNHVEKLLYLRGEEINNDLAKQISMDQIICYEMADADFINDGISIYKKLIIPIFSLNNARYYIDKFAKILIQDKNNIKIIAFSTEIADFLAKDVDNVVTAQVSELKFVIDKISEIVIWNTNNV